MGGVDQVLAALRARQAAHYAYKRAFWACLAHRGPLPEGWAERRRALWEDWRRKVERHVGVYLRVKRRFER